MLPLGPLASPLPLFLFRACEAVDGITSAWKWKINVSQQDINPQAHQRHDESRGGDPPEKALACHFQGTSDL